MYTEELCDISDVYMKLSIITINYNDCKGWQRTFDSVASQTSKDFEWIVIDGGSTDGSKELIEQHQDKLAYWCSEPDKGRYNAMNKGVNKATGEYCLFLNSGDILCDSYVIEKLNKMSFQADIVSCDIYIDGVSWKNLRTSVDKMNAFSIYENTLFHPSTWIRREVLIKCPYRENFERISDWAFFFEAIVIHNCSYQHIPLASTVFYSGGISSKPFPPGNTDRTDFLSNFYPVKHITDLRYDKIYYISVYTHRMTKCGQSVMLFLFRLVDYIDYKFLKPIDRFFVWRRLRS